MNVLEDDSKFQPRFGEQILFLDLSFNCTGNITGMTYIVESNTDDANYPYENPVVQIWRVSAVSPSTVISLVTSAMLPTKNFIKDVEAIQQSFSSPLPVQSGDILGMYIPASTKCRYEMLFQENENYTGYATQASIPLTDFTFGTNTTIISSKLLIAATIGKNLKSVFDLLRL